MRWELLFLLLSLLWLSREWVTIPIRISGDSMVPTCRNGSLAIVNRLAYVFSPPKRGDVVLVRGERDLIIKRIVGLPGEKVGLSNGALTVNGRLLPEPYVQFKGRDHVAPGILGHENYLIIGDNRSGTALAVVNRRRIVGALVSLRAQAPPSFAAAP